MKLYNYPCVLTDSAEKSYESHSRNITSVRFLFDDRYCITIGGIDRCIFVWKTDCIEEAMEVNNNNNKIK